MSEIKKWIIDVLFMNYQQWNDDNIQQFWRKQQLLY